MAPVIIAEENARPTEAFSTKASAGLAVLESLHGATEKISIDLRDMDIIDALKYLAIKGGFNLTVDKSVGGRVSLFLENVVVADAFDIILRSNELACERKNNIVAVLPQAKYEEFYGEKYQDRRQVRFVKILYADTTKIATALGNLKSSIGKVVADTNSGAVFLVDTPDKLEVLEMAIANMDLPTATRVFPTKTEVFEINYADVDSLQATVAKALTPDVGVIRADKRSKRIIVTDMPNKFDEIRTIIKEFDAKTREVFIEARIIQINLDDEFDMGVDWEILMRKAIHHGLNIKGLFPIASTATQYTSFKYGTLGTDDYTGTVKLLNTFGKAKTLSTPHIAVVDGGEAKILIGTREAYITSQVTQGQTTTTTSQSVTFIDVGVSLSVTAAINKDGFVNMKIKPEISSVARTLTTSQGNEIPIVETSEAETTVLVKDGATMIIAGLMKDRTERTVKSFPFLGKIPLLGRFLSSTSDSKVKTEIVVFLTPHIITGEETLAPLDIRGKDRMPLKR